MHLPLLRQLCETTRFTAVHAGLVCEDESSLPWLVTGAVLMSQQACTLALSEAGAELPALGGPGELLARAGDPARLEQPYTAPLKPEDHRAFDVLVAARNGVMHPKPGGVALEPSGLPQGLLTVTGLVRHLVLTQPVRPSMIDMAAAATIGEGLALIETSVDFWKTLLGSG